MSARYQGIRLMKAGLDVLVLAAAYCLAFVMRFEGVLPEQEFTGLLVSLPLVVALKIVCFTALGVRRLSWRYVSLPEAKRIFTSLSFASGLLVGWRLVSALLGLSPAAGWYNIPLGVVLIDLPLSFLGTIGLRLTLRTWAERGAPASQREQVPTLLIGAGRVGALVAKEILAGRDTGIRALGFVDENPNLIGQMIHGLPVVGSLDQFSSVVQQFEARQALITLERASGSTIRNMVRLCESCGITAKIVPDLREVVEGRVSLSHMRSVDIEDLLRREPVALDGEAISAVVRDQPVLITGAGGSIGSELCRVVCRFAPRLLVLVEKCENNLFFIHAELSRDFPEIQVVPCIADICDSARMEDLLARYSPEVVFHAAAHKHVPMMEWNPCEAIKNNVLGTKLLADLAHAAGVRSFVMISTDKAVNPTSVMGVSKRVAEIYIQALSQRSGTRFVTVRFGNVLGSAGSVLPIFKEQIARGGPVTITHPEMKRYFMTIPEACQLVLQAASMGRGGEIFILDMGEPVKIIDLARDFIRLSGLVPDQDIEIRVTGIRPGEKLFEELALTDEKAAKTRHPRIFVGRLRPHHWEQLVGQIDELGDLAFAADIERIHGKLKEIVPEYSGVQGHKLGQEVMLRADPAHPRETGSGHSALIPTGS